LVADDRPLQVERAKCASLAQLERGLKPSSPWRVGEMGSQFLSQCLAQDGLVERQLRDELLEFLVLLALLPQLAELTDIESAALLLPPVEGGSLRTVPLSKREPGWTCFPGPRPVSSAAGLRSPDTRPGRKIIGQTTRARLGRNQDRLNS